MFPISNKHKIHAVLLIVVLVATVYASQYGPEQGHTGAPGDLGDCTKCHDENLPNFGPGRVTIGGAPAVYEPGQSYTLTVQVQDPGKRRWGFQLTALDSNGDRAGTLAPLNSDTQIASDGIPVGDRQYIEHSQIGTYPGSSGGHTWQVRWTAPSTDIGVVRFFAAGNAANNDGTNRSDFIYTTSASSDSPGTVVTASLSTRPDNLVLPIGSKYTISWDATNRSSVSGYDLRYSTDDGATFPITNLIFSTTDASITSYEWTVPNTPTSLARIRLQVSTLTGTAVDIRTGRFTIGSGLGSLLPLINSARVEGKKLFITGDKFQPGAVVELNGEPQKTANDEIDSTHMLRCKKAGKWIAPGSTVQLRVRNLDGSLSDVFLYTRPIDTIVEQ